MILQKPKKTMVELEASEAGENAEKDVSKEALLYDQEKKIVQSLACNDVNLRYRQLKKLRKWLQLRSRSSFPLKEITFVRIWKGLYYNMWHSDKPLVQEDLAEKMGQLFECFNGNVETCCSFFGAFLQIMNIHWFGIDQWRMDKFLMLVRRMLRYMLRAIQNKGWTKDDIKKFNEHVQKNILAEHKISLGITMHFLDIFLEELAKVSEGKLNGEQVFEFVRPYIEFLASKRDGKLLSHCRTRIIVQLFYQSKLGREYTEKYNAWRQMGFPTKSIHDLEKVEDKANSSAEEEDESNQTDPKHLDPRAGNVDVYVPELPLEPKYYIDEINIFIHKRDSTTKSRKSLRKLLALFEKYREGEFAFGVKRMPRFEEKSEKPLMKDKVEQLQNLENEVYGVGRKLKQLNKRKRRKLLNSLNFEGVDETNFDEAIERALPQNLKGSRKNVKNSMMNGWIELELSENEEEIVKDDKATTNSKTTTKHKLENTQEEPAKKLMKTGNVEQEADKLKKAENTEQELAKKLKKTEKTVKLKDATINEIEPVAVKTNNKNATVNGFEPSKQKKKPKIVEEAEKITVEPTKTIETKEVAEKKDVAEIKKPKVLIISTSEEREEQNQKQKEKKSASKFNTMPISEWDKPLKEGEVEFFLPSRKLAVKNANKNLVINPLARRAKISAVTADTPLSSKSSPAITDSAKKRVKIALKRNTEQKPSEYIKQIRNSPSVPYDANKKPTKGLLKPNSMPGPINWYKIKNK